MFLVDFLIYIIIGVIYFVLGLLSTIPYIGLIFALIYFLFALVVIALSGLFTGLVKAALYEEITNPTIPLSTPYMGGNSNMGNPYMGNTNE